MQDMIKEIGSQAEITQSAFSISNKKVSISLVSFGHLTNKIKHENFILQAGSLAYDILRSSLNFWLEIIYDFVANNYTMICYAILIVLGDASVSRVIQMISPPFFGTVDELASPAQFGQPLEDESEENAKNDSFCNIHSIQKLGTQPIVWIPQQKGHVIGRLLLADPIRGCTELKNEKLIDQNTIVLMERSDCMFIEKVRRAQNAGAGGAIIFDHTPDTDFNATSPSFAMSGDGSVDVFIPSVFLYRKQGERLMELMSKGVENTVFVRIGAAAKNPKNNSILKTWLTNNFSADSKRKLGVKLCSPRQQSLLAAPDGRKKNKVIDGHVNIFSSPLSSSYSAVNFFENLLKSVARNQDENNDNLNVLLSKKQTISRFASTLDKILKDPTLLQLFSKSNFKLKNDQPKNEADDDINEFLNILEEKLDKQRDLKP
uniref:PA domain-containing protein n=1 Tax=Romanomermis culicivorax TaxID=13658 RepID=A0A915JPM4_ROMCU